MMNLEQQLNGLKKELRRSINKQKRLIALERKSKNLKQELISLSRKYEKLNTTLDGKTIEADKQIQLSHEISNQKHLMQ